MAAARAASKLSATTIATAWSKCATSGPAISFAVIAFALPIFAFSCVTTARTPGARSASRVSMRVMVPFEIAAPRITPYAWFGATSWRS